MYDSVEELLQKLHLVEDSSIEWKEVRIPGDRVNAPTKEDLADELAAFANWHDGVVVLGVEDRTREILGIAPDKLARVEEFVRNVCNDSIKPALPVHILAMMVPDSLGVNRAILKIEVPRSLWVHKSPGGYLFRQGSQKREMPSELLARLFQQRSQARLIRFDEQAVPGTTPETLSPDLVRLRLRPGESPESGLEKLAFIRRDDSGVLRATVAGVLLCTEDPSIYIRNAYIDAVAYRGTSRSPKFQLDAREIRGPLDRQIKEALAFCRRNSRMMAVKELVRQETPQYSPISVFEAIVNAVAHRDYSIEFSHIRLFLYEDRMEVCSPGGLPNTMTLGSMELRQASRNEVIVSDLARQPVPVDIPGLKRSFLMDRRGWGVPTILEETLRLSGKRPTYRVVDDSEVILTIPSAELPAEDSFGD